MRDFDAIVDAILAAFLLLVLIVTLMVATSGIFDACEREPRRDEWGSVHEMGGWHYEETDPTEGRTL